MLFEKIHMTTWSRKGYFEHYFTNVPCTYSMTVKLDITRIKKENRKLYPAMLYYITTVVNRHEEFRTDLDKKGEPGIYSEMFPSYTVFHKDTETFSELWTEYSSDYDTFCSRYEHDMAQLGTEKVYLENRNAGKCFSCFHDSLDKF